jgi:hypothetical protein
MPNLFPTTPNTSTSFPEKAESDIIYGSSVKFDFEQHEFVLSPTGKQQQLTNADAWAEWCIKALSTERYAYLVYGNEYGEEISTLLGKSMPKEVVESELRRMIKECLFVDPRTLSVEPFKFQWIDDGIIFSCQVTNTLGDSLILERKVVR